MRKCEPCENEMIATIYYSEPKEILNECCKWFKLSIEDVTGKDRHFFIVEVRHMISDLLYSNTELNLPLKYVGKLVGKKDHTTIMHSIKEVKKLCSVYPEYKKKYQNLHLKIYGSLKYFKY